MSRQKSKDALIARGQQAANDLFFNLIGQESPVSAAGINARGVAQIATAVEGVAAAIAAAKEAGFLLSKKVTMWDDPEIGEVVGYNEQAVGPYNGARYPVLVKFKRGTFEYSLESLTLVP